MKYPFSDPCEWHNWNIVLFRMVSKYCCKSKCWHLLQECCPCRFCIQLRDVLTDCAFVPFTTMLVKISKIQKVLFICIIWWEKKIHFCSIFQGNINKSYQDLPSLISALCFLARDVICQILSHNQDCWKAFLIAIVSTVTDLVPSLKKCKLLVVVLSSNAKKKKKKSNTSLKC